MKSTPVFILWTRSFLLFTVGALLTLAEGGPIVFDGMAYLLSPLLGIDEYTVANTLHKVMPLLLWGAALHQRRGPNRPYSLNPKDI